MSASLLSQQALLSFAALQDRRALLLGYVKNDVVTLDKLALLRTIETACGSSLSRAPENTPRPAALCFSPRLLVGLPRRFLRAGRGWFPVTLYLQMPQGCEPWEAVVRDCTLGQYVRFPRSARPSHPLRQQSLASNPSEYDKAPKVVAFGNGILCGKFLIARPNGR